MKINKNLLSDIDWLSQSIKIDNHSPMRLNVIDFHWLCFSFGPHNFTNHVEHVCISLMCTLLQDFFWYFKPRIRQILLNNIKGRLEDVYNVMLSLACVAWRFCRAGRTSGEAAIKIITPAPISSRFLCPRPPLLLSAPNQSRHATQALLS